MGILMMSLIYDIATIDKLRVAAVAYVIGGIYDVMEWSRGHSDYLADHSSIQILNRIQHFSVVL